MGRLFLIHLDGNVYSCKHCHTHLALAADIISKAFHSKHGKAYLFNKVTGPKRFDGVFTVDGNKFGSDSISKQFISSIYFTVWYIVSVNVTNGVKDDRMMITGMHTVSDIFCVGCGSIVGWKYEAAHEKSQRYKEGKYILERYKVSGPDGSLYWVTHDTRFGGSDADDV